MLYLTILDVTGQRMCSFGNNRCCSWKAETCSFSYSHCWTIKMAICHLQATQPDLHDNDIHQQEPNCGCVFSSECVQVPSLLPFLFPFI